MVFQNHGDVFTLLFNMLFFNFPTIDFGYNKYKKSAAFQRYLKYSKIRLSKKIQKLIA